LFYLFLASPGTIATAFFVIVHCRTFVLPASRFLACVHFRSSPQRVDKFPVFFINIVDLMWKKQNTFCFVFMFEILDKKLTFA